MQPTYLPWLGYFSLIQQVDEFVFLDHVQLVKRSWGVRNRIKTAQGELYLTVPVRKTASRDETTYANAAINFEEDWKKKHLKSIEASYRKAPYFDSLFPEIEALLKPDYESVGMLNSSIIRRVSQLLGLTTAFHHSSRMPGLTEKKDALLTQICKQLGATSYLSPEASSVYIDLIAPGGALAENGISVFYHQFNHPTYPQLYGEFLSHMNIFDALMNLGPVETRKTVLSGALPPIPAGLKRQETA